MLCLSILGILFILFRVKVVDIEYQLGEVKNNFKKIDIENKELKAKKARSLSTKYLQKMAIKHNLNQAKRKQIIIIPSN